MRKISLVISRVILCLVLLQSVVSCTKEPVEAYKLTNEEEQACVNLANFANDVMKKHQSNVLMSTVLDEVNKKSDVEEGLKDLLKEIVVSAYKETVFTDASINEKLLANFTNDVHLNCIETMKQ